MLLFRSQPSPASELLGRALFALCVVAMSPPLAAQKIDNSGLFEKSLQAASQTVRQYGTFGNDEVIDSAPGSNQETELERVNRIGYRLAAASGYEKYPFTFTLVDMPIPNAFALPAGQIFITRGMLDLGLDDGELAALLGHEIAHVTEEHFLRMRKRAKLLNALSTLVMAGAVYAASQTSADDVYTGPYGATRDDNTARLAQGAMQASMIATELLMRSYSRGHEDEADEEGQRLAAAAGFDPLGAHRLMSKMSARIPQARTYGYLHTHPFLDDRASAAEARAPQFKVLDEPAPPYEYRARSQKVLLDFLEGRKLDPPIVDLIEDSALVVWPQGELADNLRLKQLHEEKQRVEDRLALAQNWGELREHYERALHEVAKHTPESPLIATLEKELGEFRSKLEELYPTAVETFENGVYETPFLETFQSNYPDAAEKQAVALQLGRSYSRMGRETDAVENLLAAWNAGGDEEMRTEARTGLRNLAPMLDQLGALEVLATQADDPELKELAIVRLDAYASKYKQIENGADYLARFPKGLYAETVRTRLDHLADALYREMVLYQQSGSPAKAIEKARQILEYAPLSAAAERLSEESIDDV